MIVLLFQGKGTVSRLIQWQTRSPYSHVAVRLRDGTAIEAWEGNIFRLIGSYLLPGRITHRGVRQHPSVGMLLSSHAGGTKVTMRKVGLPDEDAAEAFLLGQVGAAYDLRSVLRFLSRREAPADDRWFCSELVAEAAVRGGRPLLRGNTAHFSPRDVAASPLLEGDYEVTAWGEAAYG